MTGQDITEADTSIPVVNGDFRLDDDVKPYLFPLSSMTEEQSIEYQNYIANEKDELVKLCNAMSFLVGITLTIVTS